MLRNINVLHYQLFLLNNIHALHFIDILCQFFNVFLVLVLGHTFNLLKFARENATNTIEILVACLLIKRGLFREIKPGGFHLVYP